MRMQLAQYNGVYEGSKADLKGSMLVQDDRKREWLANALTKATDEEYGMHLNVSDPNSDGRRAMHKAIRDRVLKMNREYGHEEYGFVILPIILMAVLTWVVKRILDRLFPR